MQSMGSAVKDVSILALVVLGIRARKKTEESDSNSESACKKRGVEYEGIPSIEANHSSGCCAVQFVRCRWESEWQEEA